MRLELSRTLETDLPGVAFGVTALAYSNEDDAPVEGAPVSVTLLPANATAGAANCTAAQLAALPGAGCSIKAGAAAAAARACQLALPCMGHFVVK